MENKYKTKDSSESKTLVKNTTMLYILNVTKIILPLVTLPYLTRVLSVDAFGVVTYVKSVMIYIQRIIDFGFILSGTKNIVRNRDSKNKIGLIIGNVVLGKLILSVLSFIVLMVMSLCIPILKNHILFVSLSFIPIFLTTFLLDFLFRGLEQMTIITYRFLIMKGISTILTFVFVKSSEDLLFIPILDIIGTLVAIFWINSTLKKMQIKIIFGNLKNVFQDLKESFNYFLSNIATTAFGALNTIIVGIVLTKSDVAYWSLIMQLVNGVQALYSPILDGIYPNMVKNQKIHLISQVILFFTPIILMGCGITFFGASFVLNVIGGPKYIGQAYLLRLMIPVLFFSFYSQLFGWPVLGAIDKVKETTSTTVMTSLIQIFGIIVLLVFNNFTLITLTLLRSITEFILFFTRFCYFRKFRFEFKDYGNRKK